MTDKADTGKTDAVKEFIELGWKELRLQSETRDYLDTKTGVILGFALVSVVEVLGFLLLVGAEKDLFKAVRWPFVTSFTLGLLGVLFAAGFSIAQLWPMDFFWPDQDFYWYVVRGMPPEKAKAAVIRRMRASARINDHVSERKSRLAISAGIASGFALLAYVASVVSILVALIR